MSWQKTAGHYDQDTQIEALAAFKDRLLDKVDYITDKCWKVSLKASIEELNDILKSGRKIGIYEGKVFVPRELEDIRRHITPLKDLRMTKQIRRFLVDILVEKGVQKDFLNSEKGQRRADVVV